TFKYLVPLGFIIFMVIGLILLGVATPTEAAATGTLGAFLLAAAYRRLTWEVVRKSVLGTLKVSVMILMIVIVSSTYSEILAFTGAASGLVEFVTNLKVPPMVIILSMMLTILVLGCFMETVAIMMITVPIFMPIVAALHYDLIWFAVIMLINLETGLLTPPFGVTLFVMKGVAPKEISMGDIWKAALPYVVIDFVCLGAVLLVPGLALYLPNLMGMK
ncbi:MAG: TRAP transporter large permease subunit, partial [Deltaproteobacteria bacterium]|nr:TRAP transporter large permease subunit [Deltaproteobacteria bacterium]